MYHCVLASVMVGGVVLLAAAVAWTTRTQLLRYLAVPWLVLTPFLSHWVWQTGNNPLRVLAPLWLVAMFGVDEWLTRGRAGAIASGSRFDATSHGHETEPTARDELIDPTNNQH